jgi:DNA-binding GntR family transcriptional regulator
VHAAGHEDLIEMLRGTDVELAKDTITKHILAAKERIFTYCQDTLSPNEPDSS